ncbi:hypothetical protein EXN66_Car019432 [Channa argus]|uniref:Uncharacterized protein n=1 Tax=Channa argus TaxID=215402 RepID=A0A6G1QMP6_CHAAH|nr:hypothetical protein EXN66_Car019432 [Channa argus]
MSELSCSAFVRRRGALGTSATSESFAEGSVFVVLDCRIHATFKLQEKKNTHTQKKKKKVYF